MNGGPSTGDGAAAVIGVLQGKRAGRAGLGNAACGARQRPDHGAPRRNGGRRLDAEADHREGGPVAGGRGHTGIAETNTGLVVDLQKAIAPPELPPGGGKAQRIGAVPIGVAAEAAGQCLPAAALRAAFDLENAKWQQCRPAGHSGFNPLGAAPAPRAAPGVIRCAVRRADPLVLRGAPAASSRAQRSGSGPAPPGAPPSRSAP